MATHLLMDRADGYMRHDASTVARALVSDEATVSSTLVQGDYSLDLHCTTKAAKSWKANPHPAGAYVSCASGP